MRRTHLTVLVLVGALSLPASSALAQEADPLPAEDPVPAADPVPPEDPAPLGEPTPTADATAEEPADEAGSTDFGYEDGGIADLGLVIGLKVGGGFGQLTSEFGATVVGELELGYNFPFMNRALGLFTSASYAGPTTEGTIPADPRMPDPGETSYEILQHQIIWTFGLIYRIPLDIPMFRPYLAAGWRAYFMQSVINGEAGEPAQPFGENKEESTSWGGAFGALGGELHFGDAGALGLEIQFGWAAIDNYVLRDTNTGSLNVALTYRIFL